VAGWAMQQLVQQEGQQGRPYMAAHVRRGDWFYYCAGGCGDCRCEDCELCSGAAVEAMDRQLVVLPL
jgi:hypothetical protein